MGIEIERKFLVDMKAFVQSDEWREGTVRIASMTQGYFSSPETLNQGQLASMRVRIERPDANKPNDTTCWLNIKSCAEGHTRQEFEYQIPFQDAYELLHLCVGSEVSKIRYYVEYKGMTWEVDDFQLDNKGLCVAEIELPSADFDFEKPSWVGREVTDDLRYTNVALSSHPFKDWT